MKLYSKAILQRLLQALFFVQVGNSLQQHREFWLRLCDQGISTNKSHLKVSLSAVFFNFIPCSEYRSYCAIISTLECPPVLINQYYKESLYDIFHEALISRVLWLLLFL